MSFEPEHWLLSETYIKKSESSQRDGNIERALEELRMAVRHLKLTMHEPEKEKNDTTRD